MRFLLRRRRASSSAMAWRPSSAGQSITSWPRSCSRKVMIRPASGAAACSSRWTATMLADRLRAALQAGGKAELLVGDLPEERAKATVDAAVLVAITNRAEPGVILTVRREHMRTHAGQIAFPGGRLDAGEDAVAAALREAHEEILLEAEAVDVVGSIEPYRTVTGYVV